MGVSRFASVAFAAVSLAGCSGLINKYVGTYGNIVTAAPVSTDFAVTYKSGAVEKWTLVDHPEKHNITYVVLVALDSIGKCKALLARTGLISRGIDADLDLTTTVLTALATAFTPIATAHALSAAAAVSSGWRSVLDADLYAKQTAAIIGTQIESSYFSQMDDYVKTLPDKAKSGLIPEVEVLQISMIHRECDIDRALGALAEKAKTPGSSNQSLSVSPKEASGSGVSADDLQIGKPIPVKLSGISWIVTAKTVNSITVKKDADSKPITFPLDGFLTLLNAQKTSTS